jgi:hypothetical protein
MTLPDLISALDAQGVRLSAHLMVDAPRGALTPELRDALAAHKALLLGRVVQELVWAELSTWRWGPAKGDPTPGIVIDRPDRGRMLAALEAAATSESPLSGSKGKAQSAD